MTSTTAAIMTVLALCGLHFRTRRRPAWPVSPTGRFYIYTGYFALAIGVFWLVGAPTSTGWEWLLGNVWALAAMTSLVYGFQALEASLSHQRNASHAIETIRDRHGHQTKSNTR